MGGRTIGIMAVVGVAITATGVWWRSQPRLPTVDVSSTAPPTTESAETQASDKIIVGDQAQKNLGLTAKPLQAGVFWKTITIQGMIVDRPGLSDRELVAPATGIISQLFHVPGDLVAEGEPLFALRLASESLQETQTEYFKTSQDIELAEARKSRLQEGGDAIPRVRIIEVENEISRLQAVARGHRLELQNRGFSEVAIDGIATGQLLSEIQLATPRKPTFAGESLGATASVTEQPLAYELQELKVELGEHVQAGQTLCRLSNHQWLAIEGRAFRDETSLLERSVAEDWSVEVDFQEEAAGDWPAITKEYFIRHLANTIDPVTRTFAFLLPLENQYKTVEHGQRRQLLWRFRPGQKVLLRIRVERLDNVFVVPADAVVTEGAEAYVFTQNVNTFERKSVHVVYRDRDRVVLANDGALPSYKKGIEQWTVPAVVRKAATQLNRMTKSGSGGVPKGFHVHADGSLHKNEEEAK